MRLFPAFYDLVMTRAERGRFGEFRKENVSPARGVIIEVGAGSGLNFRHYSPGVDVVATDPDAETLASRARPRVAGSAANIMLVAADAQLLPFRDAAFDEGVAALAMCTIPEPRRALAELRRTVRPLGVVRLLEHVRVRRPLIAQLQDWLTPIWRHVAEGCHLNRRVTDDVVGAGLAIERVDEHLGGHVQRIIARVPDVTGAPALRPVTADSTAPPSADSTVLPSVRLAQRTPMYGRNWRS